MKNMGREKEKQKICAQKKYLEREKEEKYMHKEKGEEKNTYIEKIIKEIN